MKRYIIEFGMGLDMHGQNDNKAATKAVKDAVSRSCLCGLSEVLGIKDLKNALHIKVTIACTDPTQVILDDIKAVLPIGTVEMQVQKGGLSIPGLFIPEFGDADDSIRAALACVELYIK